MKTEYVAFEDEDSQCLDVFGDGVKFLLRDEDG